MDKNTITGFILIGVAIFAFSWFNRPSPQEEAARQRRQDSIAQVEQAKLVQAKLEQALEEKAAFSDSAKVADPSINYGAFASTRTGTEKTITLENDLLELRISTKGGQLVFARLKKYDAYDKSPLVLFNDKESSFAFDLVTADNRVINSSDLYFTPLQKGDKEVTMRLNVADGRYLDLTYTLQPNDYRVGFKVKGTNMNGLLSPSTKALAFHWSQKIRQHEKGRKFEQRYIALNYRLESGSVEKLNPTGEDQQEEKDPIKWICYKDMFFSSVLIAQDGFKSGADLKSSFYEEGKYMKSYTTSASIPFDLKGEKASQMTYFFGPNKFSLLNSYDDTLTDGEVWDLQQIIPLGWLVFRWVNQYFIIPIFDFLSTYIGSMGLIIFLLTVIVKLILLPLTYKSYISSAKMRVLKPQVDEINAKYPSKDQAMEKQKEVMDLYSRAGASPMSGCLPMLLQMPILFAMFMFFPSAIELRHQSFLWASDLSTYDSIISWSTNIPLISEYFGNHLSLFCLLMTITNIIYTKFNMEQTNTGQEQMPGMKWMMYLMPVFMMVFFNQYASGLTYYYFVSLLITILQTVGMRYFINEDKLLAKLEANKRVPKKKSSLMRRLEEAQKLQAEQKRQQEALNNKNRKKR